MPIYATPAELALYMHPDDEAPAVPTDATVLLRSASALVLDATAGAVYATSADGLPTDVRVRNAMRDATMEQASAWSLAGIDPRKGVAQLARRAQSKSQGGVSVTYETDASADAERRTLASGSSLTSAALAILAAAGLIVSALNVRRGIETFPIRVDPYNALTGELLT